ncbi:hypothetical protein OEZ85_011919 [Tetradesmus obliquus]|uniref:Uncharacterized protein n=1 Tax=Tetradesmus obliquus TaxID=3088 RepID=A0ABY8TRS7_TETOB|nr:hypothetical protein OEZ85_011919 [Tetradesmus obliquus]
MDALLEEFEAGRLSLAELFAELASRSAAAAQALNALLQLVVWNHNSTPRLLVQAAEELVGSELPQQLPSFTWQSAQIHAAAGQPLCSVPLSLTVRLIRLTGAMGQMATLWASGQWQQPFQLLQQGGGQVLLQGLTLTLHCGSLDRPLQLGHGMAAGDLIAILQPSLGDADNDALITRRSLFLSQLARKHPVSFFQFLDVCASNGWR